MRSKLLVAVAVSAALVATGTFAADVKSVSRLAFGPDNILFVGPGGVAVQVAWRGQGHGRRHGGARPGSGEVYLAVSVGANKTPAVVAVTSDQKVRKLNLASMKSTTVTLKNANNSKVEFWKETPDVASRSRT